MNFFNIRTIEIKPSGAIVNRNSSLSSGLNNAANRQKNPAPSLPSANKTTIAPNTSINNPDPNKPKIDRPLRYVYLLSKSAIY